MAGPCFGFATSHHALLFCMGVVGASSPVLMLKTPQDITAVLDWFE